MPNFAVLDIYLHGQAIGTLTRLPGDKNLFAFNQEYVDDRHRSTLSLSFNDAHGSLITHFKTTQTRLPPFFANLLPEGPMRVYLAKQANVNAQREFFLLGALGEDLPGALKVIPRGDESLDILHHKESDDGETHEADEWVLRFSLAGVQLKFSAIQENDKGLTIPVHGVGGSWIVKLPSSVYPGVPENEYTMMELARQMGMEVPETALIPIDKIKGLPKEIGKLTGDAFIIKRFDREADGKGVHIEDFAQIFAVFPEGKYRFASYRNIAEVIWSEMGEKGIVEFVRRFVFNAFIGNGDMHLKNWSVIYPDKQKAALAPAYDFVSTIPYIQDDTLALTFVDSKKFSSLSIEQFKRFAAKASLPETLIIDTVLETTKNFKQLWGSIADFPLDKQIFQMINSHLKTIPLFL